MDKTPLPALTFTASTTLATPVAQACAVDETGMEYNALYTANSWMAVEVPLSAPGGVDTLSDMAQLSVTVIREGTSSKVDTLASTDVNSGGTVLTPGSVPVPGAAESE